MRRSAGEERGEEWGELRVSNTVKPGWGRQARCLMVPAFSFANGNDSESVLEVDCKKKNITYLLVYC